MDRVEKKLSSAAVPSNPALGLLPETNPGALPSAHFLPDVSSADGTFVTVLLHSNLHLNQQESL
jgi:hypothetical protein